METHLTHRTARRSLGSRSVRRSGIRTTRTKSGALRITNKPSIARLTWAVVEGKPRPGTPVTAKVKTERKSWQTRNKGRLPLQEAYQLAQAEKGVENAPN